MNNLDTAAPWVVAQKESYMGPWSYVDINLLHLLATPTIDAGASPSASQATVEAPILYSCTGHFGISTFMSPPILLGIDIDLSITWDQ